MIKYKSPIKCVHCGKKIKPLDYPDLAKNYEMVDSGVVGIIYAPYGSNRDGDIFQIGICDDCIPILEKEKKIKKIADYLLGSSLNGK